MSSSSSTRPSSRTGLIPRLWARLFGEDAARLRERMQPSHWLSYVLILSQSAAVLLVFGHAELPLLASPLWTVQIIAGLGVFVLLASVFAADMALLLTLRRMPALARNRQRWALREHLAYTLFVLATEALTLGVVLSTLDADPAALISARPLIPPDGWAFRLQIVLRVLLVSWTAVQLVIVRGRLPVLLSTLTATGREIVGAHVERKLAQLDIGDIHLPAAFRTYAAMSKPPRRVRTLWNGWLVRRELAAEAEEERQVGNVVDALDELERRRSMISADAARASLAHPTGAYAGADGATADVSSSPAVAAREPVQREDEPPTRPPTGPGSPALAPVPVRTRRRDAAAAIRLQPPPEWRGAAAQARATGAHGQRVRTSAEDRVRAVWQPGMSVSALERAAGISRSTAHKWRKVLTAELAAATMPASVGDGRAAQ